MQACTYARMYVYLHMYEHVGLWIWCICEYECANMFIFILMKTKQAQTSHIALLVLFCVKVRNTQDCFCHLCAMTTCFYAVVCADCLSCKHEIIIYNKEEDIDKGITK